MVKGTKVVCVNDVFGPEIHAMYRELPKKDEVYTVRETSLGREKVVVLDKDGKLLPGSASDHITVRILLEELHNDLDAIQKEAVRQELGFNAERFRELEEHSSTEYSEQHMLNGATVETRELVEV